MGVICANARGFAFVTPDGGGEDFFIPKKSLGGAYHGDRVKFAHVAGTKDEGAVIAVVQRNPSPVVGTVVKSGRAFKLFPDDERLPVLSIPLSSLSGAAHGQKAVAKIVAYPKGRTPTGEIFEILGDEGELFAEELSIIRAFALRDKFPKDAVDEAERAAKEEIIFDGRRDLTDKTIFTIDGDDTRDIDDAISIEKRGKNFILGVHIADVSHYVKEGGKCDGEAFLRGTSVYFPDRVLPMLPQSLSNGACSLNEGQLRYALSCVMTFSESGERISYEIFESVIESRKRTSYGEITAALEGDDKTSDKLKEILPELYQMRELCLLLERRQRERGCIDLDVKEAHICLDEGGKILIPPCERTISERMIEQFMIAANEAVAHYLNSHKYFCLYRVHGKPQSQKTERLNCFLRGIGIPADIDCDNPKQGQFRDILKSVENDPKAAIVNRIILRSMQKAEYSEQNSGHFGLGSDMYCHFTSPIRRYPDLFVHRRIKEILHSTPLPRSTFGENLKDIAKELSECERRADEAERKTDDLYKLAYMSERLGEEFDGVISGVTSAGIFCELENTVEGFIPIDDLPRDFYNLDEDKLALIGGRRCFRLGDCVRVRAVDCDLGRMKTLFALCDKK